MQKKGLVIFDLDGVLTETSEQHYQAWKNLADSLEIEIDYEFNESLKGISRMESLERILVHGGKANDFLEEEKIQLATKKNDEYKKLIADFTEGNLFQGVSKLISDLKERNTKIALASASKNAPALIKSMGIYDEFDYIVDPTSVKRGKPAPDIFLKAAVELGVDPSNCIGVEDSEAGIEAITRAGMYSIGIGQEKVLSQASIVFDNIASLNEYGIDKIIK